ncbi:hypothetical protein SAMN02745195_01549 [Thermoanaerobacter uzonensis DSM 18761]|uniref:TraC-like domain-containing protein n=1 Tax=Thermoanaerobacter uzonensis DSM 18761 TaxID=1123369 RepID=A0A1M4XQN7_9THEO|nr:hypothetical protein [Thermoanaerobacter uzonensis]SHE95676.1 hypothetical protein SAMN02745195_01549 [Thermoanaerobacter uzonensis DSM 18761]
MIGIFKKEKTSGKDKAKIEEQKRKAVQEWLPVKDVAEDMILLKDGRYVCVLKVMPLNISLKSENEKKRIIQTVYEALNGFKDSMQIFSIGRPVDLDSYISYLQTKSKEETNITKKRLLQEYLKYVASIVTSGEAIERRFFIMLSGKEKEELKAKAHELATNLEKSGLKVELAQDQDIIDLLFSFSHPSQSAFERAPAFNGPYLPPIFNAR